MTMYTERLEQIRKNMKANNTDAIVLFPSSNQYYLTGFRTHPGERLLLTIVPVDGEVFFIAPKLYESQVKKQSFVTNIITWTDEENPYEILKKALEEKGLSGGVFAVDDTLWAQQLLSMMAVLPQVTFKGLGNLIGDLRLKKSEEEIGLLKKAGHIVDEVVEVVRTTAKPGMTEKEIAALMDYEMKKRGAEGPSFDMIVASGENSALPHYNAGNRQVGEGEFLLLDFGALYRGYCSDTTRTLAVGDISPKMEEVYNIVKEAQEIGIKTVQPGIKAKEVDAAVREHIEKKGYGHYFTHRTGHGIGLEVHEEPYVSSLGETVLEEGMAFSIEPGIYIEGEFGVRIEDIVVVTKDGCERMNQSSKDLRFLEL